MLRVFRSKKIKIDLILNRMLNEAKRESEEKSYDEKDINNLIKYLAKTKSTELEKKIDFNNEELVNMLNQIDIFGSTIRSTEIEENEKSKVVISLHCNNNCINKHQVRLCRDSQNNKYQDTPIHSAIRFIKDKSSRNDIITALMATEKGANPQLLNKENHNYLTFAITKKMDEDLISNMLEFSPIDKHIVLDKDGNMTIELMLEKGYDTSVKRCISRIKAENISLSRLQDKDGNTLLHHLVKKNKVNILHSLFYNYSNPDDLGLSLKNKKGQTAFDIAKSKGNTTLMRMFKDYLESSTGKLGTSTSEREDPSPELRQFKVENPVQSSMQLSNN